MAGTKAEATVVRVVDGDTIRVKNSAGVEESLRILCLDTEESNAGGSKPVTPLGHAAKARALELCQPNDPVVLEFPDTTPEEQAWAKHRGNYGRPLVLLYLADGRDYQELLIEEGYSPYFCKYGNAAFAANHASYVAAERRAQIGGLGIWDQLANNGGERRNYAALCSWWELRARLIDGYRAHNDANPGAHVLNTRLDYAAIAALAREEATVTVFTELRDIRRIAGVHGVVDIGSRQQPFQLFVAEMDSRSGQAVVKLLTERYLGGVEGQDVPRPRRNYAYVTGTVKIYRERPELLVTDPEQIQDEPPRAIG